jgi:hypothetical protein
VCPPPRPGFDLSELEVGRILLDELGLGTDADEDVEVREQVGAVLADPSVLDCVVLVFPVAGSVALDDVVLCKMVSELGHRGGSMSRHHSGSGG